MYLKGNIKNEDEILTRNENIRTKDFVHGGRVSENGLLEGARCDRDLLRRQSGCDKHVTHDET